MRRYLLVLCGLILSSAMFLRCSPSSSSAGGVSCPSSDVGYGVDTTNNLICFDLTTPGTIVKTTTIAGTFGGEIIVGMDFRTIDGGLYALGNSGRVYSINTTTAIATQIGSGVSFPGATAWAWDYNPSLAVDRIRAQTDNQLNYRINPSTGAALVPPDTNLAYAGGDPNVGATPGVVASAYTNNTLNSATTALYVIDKGLDIVALQTPPNNGTLNTVGALGVDTDSDTSFDITTAGAVNTAYAVLTPPASGTSTLYTVNLGTGAATLVGTIGGGFSIKAFAAK